MGHLFYEILIFGSLLFVSACATTAPQHMILNEETRINIKSTKPEPGKSALVVARTSSWGKIYEFDTYLEKKMIGVTQKNSYFIRTDIPPGVRYVITRAENMEPVKIDFEPGRIYFLFQIPRLGVWRPRVSVALLTPEELLSTMDEGCKLLIYDAKNPGEDLSDEDYKTAIQDYEREVKEGRHKDYEGYRGILAINSESPVSQSPSDIKEAKQKNSTQSSKLVATSPKPLYLEVMKTANIREEGNTNCKIITTLKKGDRLEKMDESGGWCQVKLPWGQTGWVSKSLVKEAQ